MNIFKSSKSDKDNISLSLDGEDAKDFMEYLKEAQETDLREIERTGCVSQGRDMRNGNVIIMIPSLGLNRNERPEQMFRKMLLLFLLKTHEMVGTAYSIVYAHTAIDIINQYPLIYKFYSILPRFYKKNLQKMYIVHPNIGIRAFFEFARIFLSHKFYNKLCLLESILDFQRIIFPTQLPLPLKFLRKEDEDREVKYLGAMPSVRQSFINHIGSMEILHICAEFLRTNQGYQSPGIFRVPGDDGEVTLAKVRLQYGYHSDDPQNGWICLSENKKYIVIGNINDLYTSSDTTATVTSSSATAAANADSEDGSSSTVSVNHNKLSQIQPTKTSGTASNVSSAHTSLRLTSSSLSSTAAAAAGFTGNYGNSSNPDDNSSSSNNVENADEIPTISIVILNNPFTVAELFKLAIRDLKEPLVPLDITKDLLTLTRVYGSRPLDHTWELAVAQRLADLPLSHLSTLIYIVTFLREVGVHSASNNMDTRNLSLVFAPTIFRFEMTDLIAATMDIKIIQSVMREIMERKSLLVTSIAYFKDLYKQRRQQQQQQQQQEQHSKSNHNMREREEFDGNEMEQLLRVNPFFNDTYVMNDTNSKNNNSNNNNNNNNIGASGSDLSLSLTEKERNISAETITSGMSPAMVARMARATQHTTRRNNSHDSDQNDDNNNDDNSNNNYSDTEDNDNSSPNNSNRYFAVGRGMKQVMEDRDLPPIINNNNNNANNSNTNSKEDDLKNRAVPPVPPSRPLPEINRTNNPPISNTSHQNQHRNSNNHNSELDENEVSRGAVVLNGQIDADALRLLDDLQLHNNDR